jgi:hypothetical protein
MDPYLEQHWGDVHSRLIIYASNQLQKLLPPDLRARVEERVVIAGLGGPRSFYPDVRIIETAGRRGRLAKEASRGVLTKPLIIELPDEPETQTYIEIRERSAEGRVVTVLEILSPSNKKSGDAQEQYLRKQLELLHAGISLVEIDLLREGDWIVAVPAEALKPRLRTPYRVVVRRGWKRQRVDYYPISLDRRLPRISVPLRHTDAEVPLDLQSLIEQCYEDGGYDDVDYRAEPVPPLAPAAARWADQLLRRAGYRMPRKRKP